MSEGAPPPLDYDLPLSLESTAAGRGRRPELPQASRRPAHESVELVRAADGDHPPKRAERNRADAC